MGKLEYLDTLKRAMLGLPPDVQAKTLAYYEQRFVDGSAAGRPEPDVARELDDPKKIAMTLRTSAHLENLGGFGAKKNPANVLRVLVSAAGLGIFNLFMIVPALVYSALLFALYVCAAAFYLSGIAVTASGLAGTSELTLDWPSRFVTIDDDGHGREVHLTIANRDVVVRQERRFDTDPPPARAADEDSAGERRREHSRVLRGAETVADSSLHISTDMDAESRTTQTLVGFGMVLGGIAMCLLALLVTRFTWVGLKRYLQMNLSVLKGG